MVTRVGALESPDLQAPSRYLEHILSSSRNFLRVAEVKTFEFFGRSQALTSELSAKFFKKFKIFYFFRLLKRSVSCLTTRVDALESPDLHVPSRYLKHIL